MPIIPGREGSAFSEEWDWLVSFSMVDLSDVVGFSPLGCGLLFRCERNHSPP